MPIVGIGQSLRDLGGEIGRDALEDEREGAGLLDLERALHERPAGTHAASLDLVAAEAVDRLRGEAEMPHHGNLGVGQGGDDIGPRPFDLDRLGTALLDEGEGALDRLRRPEVEGAVGHVGDEQRALDARAAPP